MRIRIRCWGMTTSRLTCDARVARQWTMRRLGGGVLAVRVPADFLGE